MLFTLLKATKDAVSLAENTKVTEGQSVTLHCEVFKSGD